MNDRCGYVGISCPPRHGEPPQFLPFAGKGIVAEHPEFRAFRLRPGGGLHFSGAADVIQIEKRDLLRSEEHTSELQSRGHLVCRLLLEKKNYEQSRHS